MISRYSAGTHQRDVKRFLRQIPEMRACQETVDSTSRSIIFSFLDSLTLLSAQIIYRTLPHEVQQMVSYAVDPIWTRRVCAHASPSFDVQETETSGYSQNTRWILLRVAVTEYL